MKKLLMTGFAILAQVASILAADTPKNHLSGVFDKTVKDLSPYVLKLDGQTGTFHLRGDKLRNVEPGTRVWVSGQVRTELVRSVEQSPFPTQWHVYLDVTEVKRIEKAFERPDETGGSTAHQDTTNLMAGPPSSPQQVAAQIADLRKCIIPRKGTSKADVDAVFGVSKEIKKLKGKGSKASYPMHTYHLLPLKGKQDFRAFLHVTYRAGKVHYAGINHRCVTKSRVIYAQGSPEQLREQKQIEAENVRVLADLIEIQKILGNKLKNALWSKLELPGRISFFDLQLSGSPPAFHRLSNAGFPQEELDKLNVLLAKAEKLVDFPTGRKMWTYELRGKFSYKDTPITKINITTYEKPKVPWVTIVTLYSKGSNFAYNVSSKEFIDHVYKIDKRLDEWNPNLKRPPVPPNLKLFPVEKKPIRNDRDIKPGGYADQDWSFAKSGNSSPGIFRNIAFSVSQAERINAILAKSLPAKPESLVGKLYSKVFLRGSFVYAGQEVDCISLTSWGTTSLHMAEKDGMRKVLSVRNPALHEYVRGPLWVELRKLHGKLEKCEDGIFGMDSLEKQMEEIRIELQKEKEKDE